MTGCEHAYVSKGKYYTRTSGILGGELFTVFQLRECAHCSKQERRVVLKKKVAASADTYERQLRFSGIKPQNQLN